MDGQEFTDTLRDAHETPLSRLGSSKWIYALTGGEMEAEAVEAAWATESGAAHGTFAAWADDESHDEAATVFADAADTAAGHGSDSRTDTDAPVPPMYEALADLDTTAARAGGFLAWTLVAEKTLAQMVGFFVGDADPSTANTFRGYRSDLQNQQAAAADLLEGICDAEADWTAARDAAARVIKAAYRQYVETLESMGIKPKNVC